jgi:6-pyruvoyltetrahydropterin/6-carboxytetrahydropterin synthase
MTNDIRQRFTFHAAHRLQHHEGKCWNLHGHSYTALVTLSGDVDGKTGMVFDFSRIKEKIGGWIDYNWDHATLLQFDDPLVRALAPSFPHLADLEHGSFPSGFGKLYLFPDPPTSEILAQVLCAISETLLPSTVRVVSVQVSESENTSACFMPGL